jgi:hypothetical protein
LLDLLLAWEEDERHRRAVNDLNDVETSLKRLAKSEAEKLEIERQYNALREQEARRHEQARNRIQTGADEDSSDTTLSGKLRKLGEDIPKVTPEQFGPDGLAIAFEGTKKAALDALESYILYGKTGPAIIRKALAQMMVEWAKEAQLQALRQGALALAALAEGDFAGALKHGAAAMDHRNKSLIMEARRFQVQQLRVMVRAVKLAAPSET